ncbi:MAG: hypothetical protein K9M81_06545 [Chthoniobacterales bacterium]|nr:hypothetical protein [Chthoniobacterales bacterium]
MVTALDSFFDLGSMCTYSPASKCSSALPHQPLRSPRHDPYEISGLVLLHLFYFFIFKYCIHEYPRKSFGCFSFPF